MEFIWLYLFICCAVNAVCGYNTASRNMQYPTAEDNNPNLWKVVNSKLNTLLHEMETLRQNTQTWTPILRRQDGTVSFYRKWDEYRKGFGNSNAEFFIGLQNLHILTTYGAPQELLVVLVDFNGETRYAKYDHFQIGNEAEKFSLKDLGTYAGNAGDSLIEHEGMKFSTHDEDNDSSVNVNCAKQHGGGWWYYDCYMCHLTGPYKKQSESGVKGVNWNQWKGKNHSLKFAEMLIRPRL